MIGELELLGIVGKRLDSLGIGDTTPAAAARMVARYREMGPEQRMQAASKLFDAAREMVAASLPPGLSRADRRFECARRIYGVELCEAALRAHAVWTPPG